jgi:hypothetical protein
LLPGMLCLIFATVWYMLFRQGSKESQKT